MGKILICYLKKFLQTLGTRITLRNKTQPMTQKERLQRIRILKQQVTIYTLYSDYFIKKFGKKGTQILIDKALDELSFHLKNFK